MLRRLAPLFACCAFVGLPAVAQSEAEATKPEAVEEGRRHGWGLRLGYLTGDELTRSPGWPGVLQGIPGQLEMDDLPLVGVHYWIDGNERWRVEARLGAGPTTIEPACPNAEPNSPSSCAANAGSVDAILWYFEVLLMPHFDWGRWHLGIPVGLGWAALRADDDFAPEGLVAGRDDRTKMADSSGGTYSLGVRPYLDLGDRRSAFLEVRQVNMHRLVSVSYATVHSLEVTVGMNFRF